MAGNEDSYFIPSASHYSRGSQQAPRTSRNAHTQNESFHASRYTSNQSSMSGESFHETDDDDPGLAMTMDSLHLHGSRAGNKSFASYSAAGSVTKERHSMPGDYQYRHTWKKRTNTRDDLSLISGVTETAAHGVPSHHHVQEQTTNSVEDVESAVRLAAFSFKCPEGCLSRTVMISKAPRGLSEEDLSSMLSVFGDIETMYIGKQKSLGIVAVVFYSRTAAAECEESLKNAEGFPEVHPCVDVVVPPESHDAYTLSAETKKIDPYVLEVSSDQAVFTEHGEVEIGPENDKGQKLATFSDVRDKNLSLLRSANECREIPLSPSLSRKGCLFFKFLLKERSSPPSQQFLPSERTSVSLSSVNSRPTLSHLRPYPDIGPAVDVSRGQLGDQMTYVNRQQSQRAMYRSGNSYSEASVTPSQCYSQRVDARHSPRQPLNSGNQSFHIFLDDVVSGRDRRTTIMVRNIPNNYRQETFLAELDATHLSQYDFFYLPLDFSNDCNLGYAFINMCDHTKVASLFSQLHGKGWRRFSSDKVCEITYAKIQGKTALLNRFRNSSLMDKDPKFQPIVFENGVRVEFPN